MVRGRRRSDGRSGRSGTGSRLGQKKRIIRGEKWLIIASGPSLKEEDCEKARGKVKALAVNNAWELAPWADALYAADRQWWDEYQPSFRGERWSQTSPKKGIGKGGRDCQTMDIRTSAGICTVPGRIFSGGFSGHQAINLAYHFGARDIALLGYDCKGSHFFGPHKNLPNPDDRRLSSWRSSLAVVAKDAERLGVRIVNCSRDTAVECFERMEIGSWLTQTTS